MKKVFFMDAMHAVHPFSPGWDAHCRVLVLGSFPSVRSREIGFYYGHPQNRFWRVMERLFDQSVPPDTEGRRAFMLSHGVALWDVLAACDISGSSDASIRHAVPNDVPALLARGCVERVFCNGQRAYALYLRHLDAALGLPVRALPSTSPANAAWSLERLTDAWRAIL